MLYNAGVGRLSIFAVNRWLFHNMHSGRVYTRLGTVTDGQAAVALLSSPAAGGCRSCVVQLADHAVALRTDADGVQWHLLDSMAGGPQPLEAGTPLVGTIWMLAQADGGADFMPQALQVHLPGRMGMCQLVVMGPLASVTSDVGASL